MLTTVSIILAAASLAAAFPELTSHPRIRASAAHFGIAWQRYQLIGVAELAAMLGVLAGLAYRPLGIIAAACLAPLLLGAIAAHVRTGGVGRELTPALLVLVIDGLYLAVALTS